jgi:hypothetical protein
VRYIKTSSLGIRVEYLAQTTFRFSPLSFPAPRTSLKETADSPQASKAIADVYFKKAALGTHTFTGLAPLAVLSKMINMFAK